MADEVVVRIIVEGGGEPGAPPTERPTPQGAAERGRPGRGPEPPKAASSVAGTAAASVAAVQQRRAADALGKVEEKMSRAAKSLEEAARGLSNASQVMARGPLRVTQLAPQPPRPPTQMAPPEPPQLALPYRPEVPPGEPVVRPQPGVPVNRPAIPPPAQEKFPPPAVPPKYPPPAVRRFPPPAVPPEVVSARQQVRYTAFNAPKQTLLFAQPPNALPPPTPGLGAAGVAGIIALAALALSKLKDSAEAAVRGVGHFAQVMVSADADPGVFLAEAGSGVKAFGDAIFKINPVLGIFAGVAGQAVNSLGQFMQALDKTVERYAFFSPEIAVAQAQAEVRQTLGDLRRAREVGPELARYARARSDLQQQIEDMKARFIARILPLVEVLFPIVSAHLELFASILAGILEAIAHLPGLAEVVKGIRARMDAQDRAGLEGDLTTLVMDWRKSAQEQQTGRVTQY